MDETNSYAGFAIASTDPAVLQAIKTQIAAITPARLSHAEFERIIAERFHCTLMRRQDEQGEDPNNFHFVYNGLEILVGYWTREDGAESVHVLAHIDDQIGKAKEAHLLENEIRLLFGITEHDIETKNDVYTGYCSAIVNSTLLKLSLENAHTDTIS